MPTVNTNAVTHHGRRLSQTAVRSELARGADTRTTTTQNSLKCHQMQHGTYSPPAFDTIRITDCTSFNAGVSLQALMALLGHVSAGILWLGVGVSRAVLGADAGIAGCEDAVDVEGYELADGRRVGTADPRQHGDGVVGGDHDLY